MNKELTPLEAFKRFKNNLQWLEENVANLKGYFENKELYFKEDLDIIETALKDQVYDKQCFDELIKEHKILEIIKKKKVDIQTLKRTNNVIEYNSYVAKGLGEKELAQEEYDLLKEGLL